MPRPNRIIASYPASTAAIVVETSAPESPASVSTAGMTTAPGVIIDSAVDVVDFAETRQRAADHQVEIDVGPAERARGLAFLTAHREEHLALVGAGARNQRADRIEDPQRDRPLVQRPDIGAADLRGQPFNLAQGLAPVV